MLPRVIMLGTTGVGKSALCNTLAGDVTGKKYYEGDDDNTGTTEYHEEVITLSNGMLVKLIDIPGTGDKDGNDEIYMHRNVMKLKESGFINAFIIVLNA
jgi:predicted GTPase